jgi:3-phosphoshikimate 1-carboxyvinyltransferase
MEVSVSPGKLSGEVWIPASKSHTIRALLFAALAEGTSHIANPLDSSDAQAAVEACRQMGAKIDTTLKTWVVEGIGGHVEPADNVIDTGNSGTTLYLATSLAALADGWTFFTGDHQIRSRPATNLLEALKGLGAQTFSAKGNGCAPYAVRGPWKGGKISIECPTSQFLSSLLMAAPLAPSGVITEIEVPLLFEVPYAEMTLKWMEEQGITWEQEEMDYFKIPGGQAYKAFSKPVPADFSSATFFLAAAAVCGTSITLRGLDMSDSQGDKAVVYMMEKMGCKIDIKDDAITIDGSNLVGCELDLNATPDALPALAVVGCFAQGETRLVNVPQARLKETDRISVMARELAKMGADIEELEDGLVIKKSQLWGTTVNGHHDHRVVMSLAIAGMGAEGQTTISTAEAVAITVPNFWELIESLKG